MEEGLSLRLTKEVFDKEKAKIYDKINCLNSTVVEKSDKCEVKKGMSFIEEKIKEIIIVLTEERCANQDGAIKRMPFKCLSCDKDLEA